MTKHIVFFKFKAEVSENVRTSAFKAFKDGIERYIEMVPVYKQKLNVQFDFMPMDNY